MKRIRVSELRHWEDNPRDITQSQFHHLLKQLRYGELENLIIMPDMVVLNGNRRLDAYEIVGREWATCVTVEFKQQTDGTFYMYTDGELAVHLYPNDIKGNPVVFKTELQGMTEVMMVGNSHVGTFNDLKLAEMLTQVRVEPEVFEINLKSSIMAEDLVAAFGPTLPTREDEGKETEVKNPVRELRFFLKESDYAFVRSLIKKAKKELGMDNPNDVALEAFISLEDRIDGINYNG